MPCIESSKLNEARQTYLDLCKRFLAANPDHKFHTYVKSSIASHAALDRHMRAFELYAPYVKPDMKILDWGCRYAPDSCLLRTLHPQLELSGCDFPEDDFSIFHDYAQLRFQRLEHEYKLPYPDRSFDAVISSGVLEHVAFEYESLREIWRILRGGRIAVCDLPAQQFLRQRECLAPDGWLFRPYPAL